MGEVIAATGICIAALRSALEPAGYRVLEIRSEPFEKKGLLGK